MKRAKLGNRFKVLDLSKNVSKSFYQNLSQKSAFISHAQLQSNGKSEFHVSEPLWFFYLLKVKVELLTLHEEK